MKRIIVILLAMLGIAVHAETKVLCTTTPMTILTKAVLHRIHGYKVEQMISSSLGCPHDYVMTPDDMRKLSSADVIILNGLGMEDFLDKSVSRLKKGAVMLDTSKANKDVLEYLEDENHKHDANCKHAKNEHLFASPDTAGKIVQYIAQFFMDRDPKNAAKYLANAERYSSELQTIYREYDKFGYRIPDEKRNIAVQHGIFDYMARSAKLNVKAYIQKHAGAEPSAAEIKNLIGKLKKDKVVLILAEKGYPDRVTKLISLETGIPVLTLDTNPPDGITDPEFYLKMFKYNLAKLKAFYSK